MDIDTSQQFYARIAADRDAAVAQLMAVLQCSRTEIEPQIQAEYERRLQAVQRTTRPNSSVQWFDIANEAYCAAVAGGPMPAWWSEKKGVTDGH